MTHPSRSTSSLVWAQLPRAGLGNRMLVWARAYQFAWLNHLPLFTSSWYHFSPRAWLTNTTDKRHYRNYFTQWNPSPFAYIKRYTYRAVIEPEIIVHDKISPQTCYLFNEIPHWRDWFGPFRENREQIRSALWGAIAPPIRAKVDELAPPIIALHARMGDFPAWNPNEDFALAGTARTPTSYFLALIEEIRTFTKAQIPITIFSDGSNEELAALLALPNVIRAEINTALVDILRLSQSQLIITSSGSSFSYWGGFLADAPLLLHPDHIHSAIRPLTIIERWFEGGVRGPAEQWPTLLRRNLLELATTYRSVEE